MQNISVNLQTTTQGKRVNEGREKKEDNLEMWAGPKVDLGQKRGHSDLSTKSTYTSNLTTQELLESNFVMDLQTPKPQGINKNKTLRGLT